MDGWCINDVQMDGVLIMYRRTDRQMDGWCINDVQMYRQTDGWCINDAFMN